MIEYDVILLECKERTLNLANQWLATANAHFRAADAALEEANNTLSSAVSQAQVSPKTKSIDSLQSYLVDGYQDALEHYRAALKANDVATQQLDGAQAKLDNATHQLNSLKAGLSAATAAALAA
jgi:exonuclease VII small subunit